MKLKFLRFSCQGALIFAQPNPFQVLPQIPARKSPQTPACPWKVRWMTKVSSSVGFTVSFFGQLGHWPSNLQQQQEDFIADIDVNIRCSRSLKFGWNNCTKSRSKYFREAVLGWLECKEDGGVSKHEQWSHDSAAGPSNPTLISGSRSNDWFC